MFPFSFERTIEIPISGVDTNSALEMIINTLAVRIEAEKPSRFNVSENQITFSGGMFRFVPNWNLLICIDDGVIDFVQDNQKIFVSYKFWFLVLFSFASFVAFLFGVAIFPSGFTMQNVVVAAGTWLWFFGVNFIITIIRFEMLIRSVARDKFYRK